MSSIGFVYLSSMIWPKDSVQVSYQWVVLVVVCLGEFAWELDGGVTIRAPEVVFRRAPAFDGQILAKGSLQRTAASVGGKPTEFQTTTSLLRVWRIVR